MTQSSLLEVPPPAELARARSEYAPRLYEIVASYNSQRAAWEALHQANIFTEPVGRFYASVRKVGMDGTLDALFTAERLDAIRSFVEGPRPVSLPRVSVSTLANQFYCEMQVHLARTHSLRTESVELAAGARHGHRDERRRGRAAHRRVAMHEQRALAVPRGEKLSDPAHVLGVGAAGHVLLVDVEKAQREVSLGCDSRGRLDRGARVDEREHVRGLVLRRDAVHPRDRADPDRSVGGHKIGPVISPQTRVRPQVMPRSYVRAWRGRW